ncbi:methyl-accepting chemotaxis protein [Clostridium tyrobutyricum]|uniref:methyl-accepting chemotaxis protein n=1 Tax=Clostridium tyrobutyricum TaxID=1519 RepID=UPI001C38D719|nr:methyl-accepting chemotaxis protein [Clostridium tyrobutyricum]MBV4419430.1 methyl-accepting chemotaxis protein [Clostridium tyrobutyricum]
MSIKRKVPLLIGMLILITMIVSSIVVYHQTSTKLYDVSRAEMKSLTSSYIITLNHMIDKEKVKMDGMSNKKSVIDLLQLNSGSYGSTEYKNAVKQSSAELSNYVKQQGNLEHAFIVDKSGTIIADSDSNLINKNISDRAYNMEVLKGKDTISETMKSKSTAQQIIIFASPIRIQGKIYGYTASAVFAKSFSESFKNITISNTKGSYACLVDESGNIVFYPDVSQIGKPLLNDSLKNLSKQIQNRKIIASNYISYKYQGKQKLSYLNLVPNVNWIFMVTADKSAILSGARKVTIMIIIIMIIVAVIAIFAGILLSKKIIDPIQDITDIVNSTAKLNLNNLNKNNQYDYLEKSKDEIGIIYKAIVSMRSTLRNAVGQLLSISDKVNKNAIFLENLTEELKTYINDTSTEAENISAGIEENSAAAQEISSASSEMSNAVDDMANKAEKGSGISEDIAERADEFKKSSNQSQDNANNIYRSVKTQLETAIEDSKAVNKINELTESIIDITKQTDLLALNASIEAARAGEAGKGFTVVADEVKKLAQESGETANNIKNIVDLVESAVGKLVHSSNSALEFLENAISGDYVKMVQIADKYNKDSLTMNNFMMDFSAVSEELNASIEGIVKSTAEMAQTITESAGGMQNISQKTNNISEKIDNINSSAIDNKKSVDSLHDVIDKFHL